jgi:predicted GIY-YIG superfamily endonuclease
MYLRFPNSGEFLSVIFSFFLYGSLPVICFASQEDSAAKSEVDAPADLSELRAVIQAAFEKTHDGYSSDEVVLNSQLNDAFINQCHRSLPKVEAVTLNWTLLNMRKAGLLTTETTKRQSVETETVRPVAEIAARSIQDKHKVSADRMMADPKMRAEFDEVVRSIDAGADLYAARKAAFQLRKQRRLKPELIVRIADWGRTIQAFSLKQLADEPGLVPEHPGIYIFRDQTGFLYIGQSENLRQRLGEHLSESSNFALGKYLARRPVDEQAQEPATSISIEIHSFDPESRGKETMIRRAYESELIRSRKPRFNIQP